MNKQTNDLLSKEMDNIVDILMDRLMEEVEVRMKICTKEVLTCKEAAQYMGIALSYLYKLTMDRVIPHYKPNGKVVYFNRKELDDWLLHNRVASSSEIEQKSNAFCMKQKGGER